MRVVSLVPSWTETLLEAGVNVVGRTRFCIHPELRVQDIPAVGGTKDLDISLLEKLKPDLLILDREENLPWMADRNFAPSIHCSHVQSADDVPQELEVLSKILGNSHLSSLAEEWRTVLASPQFPKERVSELRGVLQWIRKPQKEPQKLLYIIWRGPWMTVSRNTFVGSILSHLGYGGRIPAFTEKYPKIDLGNFDPAETLLLFSSEPYPFAKKIAELGALDFPSALVDGESFSWFGVRSLRFLRGHE